MDSQAIESSKNQSLPTSKEVLEEIPDEEIPDD